MIEVIGIEEKDTGRTIFCPIGGFGLAKGDLCLVQGQLGIDLGEVVTDVRPVQETYLTSVHEISIIRKATSEDLARLRELKELEDKAYHFCKVKIKERQLQMKLVRVKYLFDGSKAIFFFTAESRIDFRELVRDLAAEFRCRIEMKQIGVRDEARMIGGFGGCGRMLCCSCYLRDFETVSIKMAKDQGLTLIPSKISGMCGRLMCCLMYEYCTYAEVRSRIPKVGKKVETPKGVGRIKQINALKETVLIELENGDRFEAAIPQAASQEMLFKPIVADAAEPEPTAEYMPALPPDELDSLRKLAQENGNGELLEVVPAKSTPQEVKPNSTENDAAPAAPKIESPNSPPKGPAPGMPTGELGARQHYHPRRDRHPHDRSGRPEQRQGPPGGSDRRGKEQQPSRPSPGAEGNKPIDRERKPGPGGPNPQGQQRSRRRRPGNRPPQQQRPNEKPQGNR